mmetsp:Transcript_37708/g.60483  ORF Transcript_37708/g.60483 Transcript_37708/m.60483 type:complete len:154 (-) Transcript_37708:1063-1524(-)
MRGAAESDQPNVDLKIYRAHQHARDFVVDGSSGGGHGVMRRGAAVKRQSLVPDVSEHVLRRVTNLTKIIMENTTARITSKPPPPPPPEYAVYENADESLVVASVMEDAEGPTRKLLEVANCEIISNIRDRSLEVGKFLTTYYATEGEYLDATF